MATETQAAETHADGLADAVGVAEHSAGATGMPQLNFEHWGNQIFWLLITLVVIYFLLSRFALPRIAAVLAERQGTITKDLAAAEDLKEKAAEAEKAYDTALANARAEAQEIVAKAKAEIDADLKAAMADADARIAEKAAESEAKIAEIEAGAMDAVKDVAKDTAKEIVAAFGGSADARSVTAAINARMKG